MIKKMGIEWNLRLRMAERGLYSTTDLVPLLAERGIHLSREQVYRPVANTPQRLSTDVLAALCDVLGCTPNDLITISVVNEQGAKSAGTAQPGQRSGRRSGSGSGAAPPAQRTTIRRPEHLDQG